jgi:glutathione S-transferase
VVHAPLGAHEAGRHRLRRSDGALRFVRAESQFKHTIAPLNPVAKVPVLVDGDLVVWDTLAIAEYLAETFPDKRCGPRAPPTGRAHAASAPRCIRASGACAAIAA